MRRQALGGQVGSRSRWGGTVACSAGVAESVPTSPSCRPWAGASVPCMPVSRLPQRRDRVPSGAGRVSRTTPRQGCEAKRSTRRAWPWRGVVHWVCPHGRHR